jgi:hypothetical protein
MTQHKAHSQDAKASRDHEQWSAATHRQHLLLDEPRTVRRRDGMHVPDNHMNRPAVRNVNHHHGHNHHSFLCFPMPLTPGLVLRSDALLSEPNALCRSGAS